LDKANYGGDSLFLLKQCKTQYAVAVDQDGTTLQKENNPVSQG
jgi:hypothetical protein